MEPPKGVFEAERRQSLRTEVEVNLCLRKCSMWMDGEISGERIA